MKERLRSRRLQWFGYLERIEEGDCPSKCGTLNVSVTLNTELGNLECSE